MICLPPSPRDALLTPWRDVNYQIGTDSFLRLRWVDWQVRAWKGFLGEPGGDDAFCKSYDCSAAHGTIARFKAEDYDDVGERSAPLAPFDLALPYLRRLVLWALEYISRLIALAHLSSRSESLSKTDILTHPLGNGWNDTLALVLSILLVKNWKLRLAEDAVCWFLYTHLSLLSSSHNSKSCAFREEWCKMFVLVWVGARGLAFCHVFLCDPSKKVLVQQNSFLVLATKL